MAVNEQTGFDLSMASGLTGTFPYSFKVLRREDLQVQIDGVVIDGTGDYSYTVTGIGEDAGGIVEITPFPTGGATVLRALVPGLDRQTNYQYVGDLKSLTVNVDFDRLWLAMQQIQRRALMLPLTEPTGQTLQASAAERAGKALIFDELGNPVPSPTSFEDAGENAAIAVQAAAEANQSASAAEESASRVDLGALDQAVEDSQEAQAAAEGARDVATTSAGTATSQANRAESEADRAEVARDAAEDAVQYDYLVDDDAALAAIVGMSSGQRAFVRDTEHVWRYDGSDWIDMGLGPTAGNVSQDYLLSMLRPASKYPHEFADKNLRSRTVIDENGDVLAIKARISELEAGQIGVGGTIIGRFNSKQAYSFSDKFGREAVAITENGDLVADTISVRNFNALTVNVDQLNVTAAPNPRPPVLYGMPQVLVYGESLSVGGAGGPALSTANTTPALMFDGGVRTNYYTTSLAADYHAGVIPLVEGFGPIDTDGPNVETICTGAMMMYYQLLQGDGWDIDRHKVLISAGGRSGKKISEMMAGDVWYPRMKLDLVHGPLRAREAGATSAILGCLMMIGSNDQDAGTSAESFISNARVLRAQIHEDRTAGMQQPFDMPMIFSQLAPRGSGYPTISLAIRDLHKRDPLIFSVGPSYQFDYVDNVHMTNASYRWRGAYFGWWLYQIFNGERPEPLQPVAIISAGNVVQVRFNRSIVIDTSWMTDPGYYGFSVLDGLGGGITISSVMQTQGDTIEITCTDSVPAGASLGYAIQPGGSMSGRTGRRGNIRDNNGMVFAPGVLDLPMYNWCEVFHEIIEVL